ASGNGCSSTHGWGRLGQRRDPPSSAAGGWCWHPLPIMTWSGCFATAEPTASSRSRVTGSAATGVSIRRRRVRRRTSGNSCRTSPPLWVLTDQSQAVTESDPVKLPHSTLWGLRRVVANEHPLLSARIVDVDETRASWAALADELAQAPGEDELAFRHGVRFVHR